MRTPDGPRNLHQPATSIPVALNNASVILVSTEAALTGVALREMSGVAVATVDFFDGGSANGYLLASYACPAGGQIAPPLPYCGLWAGNGIFVVVGGQVQGAVHVIQSGIEEESE